MSHGIIARRRPFYFRKVKLSRQSEALQAEIQARYADEWAKAGFFKRLKLRWRMEAEFRNSPIHHRPSPHSLFLL